MFLYCNETLKVSDCMVCNEDERISVCVLGGYKACLLLEAMV